jgi:nucleoside-diphosphate-sugar epimerase
MLLGGAPTIFGDGTQARDYVYISDVINSLLLAANSLTLPKYSDFNIGSGQPRTVNDLVKTINQILETNIVAINGPVRQGDPQTSVAEIHKAEMFLGYRPLVKFSEGMTETVKYFQEQNHA